MSTEPMTPDEQIGANEQRGPRVRYELRVRFPHDDGNISEYGQMHASQAAETLRCHAAMLAALSAPVEAGATAPAPDDEFGTTCADCGETVTDERPAGETPDGPMHYGCGEPCVCKTVFTCLAHDHDEALAEGGTPAEPMVWCLIDDYGDGVPAVGPFESFAEASAHDPYDDRFVSAQITAAAWAARASTLAEPTGDTEHEARP